MGGGDDFLHCPVRNHLHLITGPKGGFVQQGVQDDRATGTLQKYQRLALHDAGSLWRDCPMMNGDPQYDCDTSP